MKKIPTLYKKDWSDTRLAYDEINPEADWVLTEPKDKYKATIKFDGTACLIQDGRYYKRYDRKLKKKFRQQIVNMRYLPKEEDFKPAPENWMAAEPCPTKAGRYHWYGWLPVLEEEPSDKWHIEAIRTVRASGDLGLIVDKNYYEDGTYELVGPKVQKNPYYLNTHELWKHGSVVIENVPITFDGLELFLNNHKIEGIVWHHIDGRMAKMKRRDFGFGWPVPEELLDCTTRKA